MGLKKILSNIVFINCLDELFIQTSDGLKKFDVLVDEFDDMFDRYKNILGENEILEEDKNMFSEVAMLKEKFNNSFYSILRSSGFDDIKAELDKLEGDQFISQLIDVEYFESNSKWFFDNGQWLYKNNKFFDGFQFCDGKSWIDMSPLLDDMGERIIEDGLYVYQISPEYINKFKEKEMLYDRSEEIKQFIPVLENLCLEEENFDTLREGLKTIEETNKEMKFYIENIENQIRYLRLKEEEVEGEDDVQNIDNYIGVYSSLKSQI